MRLPHLPNPSSLIARGLFLAAGLVIISVLYVPMIVWEWLNPEEAMRVEEEFEEMREG